MSVKKIESSASPSSAITDDNVTGTTETTTPIDWQCRFEKISGRFGHLQQTGLWADCEFAVGVRGTSFTAHKLVLAAVSPVFDAMFYGAMAESTPNAETGRTLVRVPDVQPHIFHMLLDYMYADKLEVTTVKQACDLFAAADKYMLPYVKQRCRSFLSKTCDASNVCTAYEFAVLFDEEKIKLQCMQFICKNTLQVLSNDAIMDIQPATLHTILDQNHLQKGSEVKLLLLVNRLADQFETHEIRAAYQKIRFNQIDPKFLAANLGETCGAISETEQLDIIKAVLLQNKKMMPYGFSWNVIRFEHEMNLDGLNVKSQAPVLLQQVQQPFNFAAPNPNLVPRS